MLRTILKEVKEFKRASIATPIYMILEVLMEMIIPFLMASIIDQGVNAGNIHHIYKVGGLMIVAALLGLLAGMAGERIPDVAAYVHACTGKHYLRHDDGIFNQ